jgi:hypothetical protein
MKLISQNINSIVRKILQKQHPLFAEILLNWDKIVGVKFKGKTRPLKISISKEKGININILQVIADNPSVSLELSYQQDIIIERIAVYLGCKGIQKLRIIVR